MSARRQPAGAPVTRHEAEALSIFMRKCCDIAVAASKIIRRGNGDHSAAVDSGPDHKTGLALEIGDMIATAMSLTDAGLIDIRDVAAGIRRKARELEALAAKRADGMTDRGAIFSDAIAGYVHRKRHGGMLS